MRHGLLGRVLVSLLLLVSPVWAQQGLLINGSRTIAGTINAATTTGSGSAYLMVLDPPITDYVINQCFTFRAHVANTGAATLNVNGVAIRPMKKFVGGAQADLVAGDITSGQIVLACYDGTVMQLVGAGLAGGAGGGLGYTPENVINKSTATSLGTSNTLYPSQSAVKSYVDAATVGLSGSTAHIVTNQAEASLTNEVNLGALPSGVLKHTVSGGVSTPATAVAGTDYQAPLGFTPENASNKSTATILGTSDTAYPTQNAVKSYVDAATTTLSGSAAHMVTTQAEPSLTNEVNLGALASGLLKHSVSGGVSTPATAVSGVDYQIPLGFTPESVANKSPNTALGTSNTLYPTQGAVKTYVDTATRAPGDGMVNASGYGVTCDGVTQTAAALQTALNTMPVGATLLLPHGICVLNATLTITRSLSMRGAGMNLTTLQQSVANLPVLTVTATNIRLEGFTATHSGTPVAGGDGVVIHQDAGLDAISLQHIAAHRNWRGFVLGCIAYGSGENLQANNNNNNGFEFIYPAACGVVQWDIGHSIAQLNKGAGFTGLNTARADAIGPWLTETVSFANNQGGYVFQSTAGHALYDVRLKSVLSSSDNVAGIYLNTYGAAHLISDPWVEYVGELGGFPLGTDGTPSVASHTGHCLGLSANNQPGIAITGGLYWNCAWSGVALDAPYSSLTGGTSMGNGLALNPALSTRAGVHIAGTGVSVTGHTFVNLNPPTTLHYIHLEGPLERLAIGSNTYMAGLPEEAFIDATEATLPTTLLGTVREPAEREQAMGTVLGEYVASGCLPFIVPSSLILGNFACTGFIQDTSVTPPRLRAIKQGFSPVGPLSSADGIFWLALHRDQAGLVAGWNRHPGTHYLWTYGAPTPPAVPQGQILAKITVAGLVVTAIEDWRVPASFVRNGTYDVTDPLYGGVADDSTDVGPPIQAAINAAMAQRGRLVRIPQGTYRLSSAITIPHGIDLHGDGWAPNELTLLGLNTDPRRGTWIHLWNTGFIPITVVGAGTTIRDLAFDQDQPAATTPGWTPVPYDFVIDVATPSTWGNGDINLLNLFFFKCTNGIRQRSVATMAGGRINMHGIWGHVFDVGIHLEFMADVSRISDVHFWPWWSQDAPVWEYNILHTVGLSLWRADSLVLRDIFVFGANIGMLFAPNSFGPTTGFLATNIQLDSVRAGIFHNQPNSNGHIANMRLAGGWDGITYSPHFENATSLIMQAANTRLMVTNLEMLSVGDNCAKVVAAGSVLMVTNLWCRNWNMNGANAPGIFSGSGGAFHLSGTQTFSDGHGAVDVGGNVNAAVFPGGATFNQSGAFYANTIGNRPTIGFSPGNFLQWYPEGNAFVLGAGAGTYDTGGVKKYLCIQDRVVTVGTSCP